MSGQPERSERLSGCNVTYRGGMSNSQGVLSRRRLLRIGAMGRLAVLGAAGGGKRDSTRATNSTSTAERPVLTQPVDFAFW